MESTEETGGRIKKKVVAEDALVKYFFSCRRVVSRTTRLLMELESEYVFPLLFPPLLLIGKVGRPLFLESFSESCVAPVIFRLH